MKMAIMTSICPASIQDVIYQKVDTVKTYIGMKMSVLTLVRNRVAMMGGGAVPMEIGEVFEDWGYDEAIDVDLVDKASVQCHSCGGWGHYSRECPSQKGKAKGGKAPYAKGTGKGPYGKGNVGKGYGNIGFPKGKSKGKGYQGTCYNCGKVGHKAAECRGAGAVEVEAGSVEEQDAEVNGVWGTPTVWTVANVNVQKDDWAVKIVDRKGSQKSRKTTTTTRNRFQALGADDDGKEPPIMIAGVSCVSEQPRVEHGQAAIDRRNSTVHGDGGPKQIFSICETTNFELKCGSHRAKVDGRAAIGRRNSTVHGDGGPKQNFSICETTNFELKCGSHPAKVEVNGIEKKKKLTKGKITVDSGAGGSVWPKAMEVPGPMLRKAGVRFEAANGTPIENYGQKMIFFMVKGRSCSMKYNVTDVRKPLAAVSAIVDEGNIVVFKPGLRTSYIENIASGEKLPLLRENGTYVLEMEYEKVDEKVKENPMDIDSADAVATPFTGRA
jgi:hypothetical protein